MGGWSKKNLIWGISNAKNRTEFLFLNNNPIKDRQNNQNPITV